MRADFRRSARCFFGLAFAVAVSGCALERTGMTSSSASPMPWFNFQLAAPKKDNPNYQKSIARSTADRAVVVKPAIAPVQKEIRWPEISLPSFRREAQLLPRTDDQASKPPITASSETDDRDIDFN
jgi:hypothetical protein